MAREEKIIVKIEPRIKEEFQAYCDELGVSMSAMVALLVGQAVKANKRQEVIGDEVIKQIFEKMVAEGVKLGSEGITKLAEEAGISP